MTPLKTSIVALILIRPFIRFLNLQSNLMYVLPDSGLKIEIFMYSASTDSNTQLDPSLIQLFFGKEFLEKIYQDHIQD